MMGGLYDGTDLADKTFYGFRLNPDDGGLNVEVINDGSLVSLPQDAVIDKYDYKQWCWSADTLQFEFNNTGHLMMRFV